MNFRDLEKLLKQDGWQLKDIKGSHHQYIHPTKPGKITYPDIVEILNLVHSFNT